jgi:hypothetical protein
MKTRNHLLLTLATPAIPACFGQPLVVSKNQDNGPDSLRAAVDGANNGDTVTFSNGFAGTITFSSAELSIPKSITIRGAGAHAVTVEGDGADRVFEITGGATVTISGLTISNGVVLTSGDVQGGGILINQGCASAGRQTNSNDKMP